MNASWDTWMLWGIDWLLFVGGMVAVVYGVVGPRRRAARSCVKCGYDMGGIAGRRCPECGREAKSERELARRRVSLGALVVGAALMFASYAMWVPVRLSREGWQAVIPTAGLVLGTPWYIEEEVGAGNDMTRLLIERVRAEELGRWHWEFMSRCALRKDAAELVVSWNKRSGGWAKLMAVGLAAGAVPQGQVDRLMDVAVIDVKTRGEWPRDAVAYVEYTVDLWAPQADARDVCVQAVDAQGRLLDRRMVLEGASKATQANFPELAQYMLPKTLKLGSGEGVSGTERYRVELVRVGSDGVTSEPFASKEVAIVRGEQDVASLPVVKTNDVRVRLDSQMFGVTPLRAAGVVSMLDAGEKMYAFLTPMNDAGSLLKGVTVGARVEVYRGTAKKYEARVWFRPDDREWSVGVPLEAVDSGKEGDGDWWIAVQSDPEVALQDMEAEKVWSGRSVTVLGK